MINLNYHHLYYFSVIAKTGSLAKASEVLLLAQPTLSLQLKQLEKAFGKPLFERRKQRLFLTDHGRFVLGYAERIFGAGAELHEALKSGPHSGRVVFNLGILNGTPRAFAHALLESFLALSPKAHVTVREGDMNSLLADLGEHRVEAVLSDASIRTQDQESFDNHLIAKVPIVFAASPALAKRFPKVPDSLNGAPLILPSSPSRLYQEILDRLAEWKVMPIVVADIQDIELCRRMAVSGFGIVPLNAYTFSVSLPKGGLVRLKTSRQADFYESVYLISKKRTHPNPLLDQVVRSMGQRYLAVKTTH